MTHFGDPLDTRPHAVKLAEFLQACVSRVTWPVGDVGADDGGDPPLTLTDDSPEPPSWLANFAPRKDAS